MIEPVRGFPGNVFSSRPFLESLAAARYPGKRTTIDDHALGGRVFRLLTVNGRPVTAVRWLDFHEPIAASAAGARPLDYLSHVAVASLTASEWQARDAARMPGSPSPYIDWTSAERDAGASVSARRRWRALTRGIADVVYSYDDDDSGAIEQCVAWKRAQYRATGVGDALADPASRRLLQELRDRGLLVTSTIRGGGAVLAAHVGMEWEGRLYWWIPAFDPVHAHLSVGRVLLERLLSDSRARGHREFDFLLGDEAYKWQFATHTRVVTALGFPPLALRARRRARSTIRTALQRAPALWTMMQSLRRRLRAT